MLSEYVNFFFLSSFYLFYDEHMFFLLPFNLFYFSKLRMFIANDFLDTMSNGKQQ